MLVLTSLFISVSASLPRTSYINMIDIWLIFSLLVPFAEVILHVAMERLRPNDEELESPPKWSETNGRSDPYKTLRRLDRFGKCGFPVLFSIVTAVYFLVGMHQSSI